MPAISDHSVQLSSRSRRAGLLLCIIVLVYGTCYLSTSQAQPPGPEQAPSATAPANTPGDETDEHVAPNTVEVEPLATDVQISQRLERILAASNWFDDPSVQVEEGIAFLSGATDSEVRKKWAGDLARNTRDVVAVINHIRIKQPSIWDWTPGIESLRKLADNVVRRLPLIIFGVIVLGVAWLLGRGLTSLLRRSLTDKNSLNRLLREVIARAAGVGVFLLGLYLVLLVIGLARLALTVLGGTGLLGLVIGIAFRDITENFLASIFLSIQRPFRAGELVEIDGHTGFVQQLSVRTTNLMTLDGNVVQIPNSIVYKSTLCNFSSNPNRREAFIIGIGYDEVVSKAQQVAMEVLTKHPAVLDHPEPWVLVDNLGPSTVNLKVYFWLDGSKHSWLKVLSSVIRLVKRAYQEHGISMPDEAREIIVSREIPVSVTLRGQGENTEGILPGELDPSAADDKPSSASMAAEGLQSRPGKILKDKPAEPDTISTASEGSLTSEAETARSQARNVTPPDDEVDLLK